MANTIEIIGSWPSGETEYVIGTENPSKLPLVSDADNGDVLTVVNGAWKDAAPTGGGGGGGVFMVNFAWEDEDAESPVADKTFSEITAAFTAGQKVVGVENYEGDILNFELARVKEGFVAFVSIDGARLALEAGGSLVCNEYIINSDNTLETVFKEYSLTPA